MLPFKIASFDIVDCYVIFTFYYTKKSIVFIPNTGASLIRFCFCKLLRLGHNFFLYFLMIKCFIYTAQVNS